MLCPRHLHPGLTLLPDCRMLTTAQDGLYFTTVSMSTVGYGDLVASTPLSRAFTGTWIIVGLLFIFAEFVAMFNTAIATLTKVTHSVIHWVLNVKPSESINPNVLKPNESQDVGSLLVFYFKGTWVALLWFFASQVLISLLISYADPQMKYDDILWYLFITASTVGYGDVNIRSQIGRLLAVAHVMISVMWLAALFAHVRGLNTARQRQVARVEMLRRQLDAEMIAGMDRDGNGVDIIEFIVETLMHLGTEVGGEKLDWKHIRPIIAQFRAFDVDHDGRLTHKDLAQLARLRASLMGDGSATDHIIKAAAKTQLDEESTGGRADGAGEKHWRKTRSAFKASALLDMHVRRLAADTLASKQWADGTSYVGAIKNGQPSGHGRTSWPDGSSYEGMHEYGLPHGRGRISYVDGTSWEGAWLNGKRHGHGVRVGPNGETEEGEWIMGQRAAWARAQMEQRQKEAAEEAKLKLAAKQLPRGRSDAAAALAQMAKTRQKSVRVMPVEDVEEVEELEAPQPEQRA